MVKYRGERPAEVAFGVWRGASTAMVRVATGGCCKKARSPLNAFRPKVAATESLQVALPTMEAIEVAGVAHLRSPRVQPSVGTQMDPSQAVGFGFAARNDAR